MAASSRSGSSSLSPSEQWLLATATLIIILGFLAYAVYDAIVASASELLQRLLVISPLLLVIAVHWLSIGENNTHMRCSGRPDAAVGFPWGVAFLLLLLLFPWSAAFLLLMLYFFFLTN